MKNKRRKGEVRYGGIFLGLLVGLVVGTIIDNRAFGLFVGFIFWCTWD